MDDRVLARMKLHLAQATYKVTELEALEKQTPNTTSTNNTRLALARRLRSARELRAGWSVAVNSVRSELARMAEDETELDKKFPPAPEPLVGWIRYAEDTDNDVVCNRPLCKNAYGEDGRKWVAVRSGDSDSLRCDECGRELSE